MTQCVVTCHSCVTEDIPKKWRWLCQACADDCQDNHLRDTGHQTELLVVDEEPAVGAVNARRLERIVMADRIAKAMGW
jgi:hypothetical protein